MELLGMVFGFYLLASIVMYGYVGFFATGPNVYEDDREAEYITEQSGRAEAEALAWLVWGVSFAVVHIVAFVLIASASVFAVSNASAFPVYTFNNAAIDTGSMILAWLIAAAFAGAYAIATSLARGLAEVVVKLHFVAWIAAVAAGQWLAGRNGWLVGREELGSIIVSSGLIIVGITAIMLGGVSWLGVGLSVAAIVILAARAFMLWRAHRDALVLKGE